MHTSFLADSFRESSSPTLWNQVFNSFINQTHDTPRHTLHAKKKKIKQLKFHPSKKSKLNSISFLLVFIFVAVIVVFLRVIEVSNNRREFC